MKAPNAVTIQVTFQETAIQQLNLMVAVTEVLNHEAFKDTPKETKAYALRQLANIIEKSKDESEDEEVPFG